MMHQPGSTTPVAVRHPHLLLGGAAGRRQGCPLAARQVHQHQAGLDALHPAALLLLPLEVHLQARQHTASCRWAWLALGNNNRRRASQCWKPVQPAGTCWDLLGPGPAGPGAWLACVTKMACEREERPLPSVRSVLRRNDASSSLRCRREGRQQWVEIWGYGGGGLRGCSNSRGGRTVQLRGRLTRRYGEKAEGRQALPQATKHLQECPPPATVAHCGLPLQPTYSQAGRASHCSPPHPPPAPALTPLLAPAGPAGC